MEKEPQPKFTFRKATPGDAEALRNMQAESWRATYASPENDVSQEWIDEFTGSWLTPEALRESGAILAKIVSDPTQFYRLAEQNGEIVGFIHGALCDDGTKELEAIYTDPRTFGNGLGGQLMHLAEEWFGDDKVGLSVVSYNERAIRFYEKYGFAKVPGSETLYREIMPVVRMTREHAEAK